MYVLRNIETRSCSPCCTVKVISITYSRCVFVALGIQHAVRMLRIVIRDLLGYPISFHIIS